MFRKFRKIFEKVTKVEEDPPIHEQVTEKRLHADLQPDQDLLHMARAAIADENYGLAISHYSKIVAAEPQSYSGYIGLGYALTEMSQWSESIPALNQALRLNTESADAFFLLGRAYLGLGQMVEADAAWARAHLLAPMLEQVYADYCLLLFKQGDIDRALKLMKAGVGNFPENSLFHFFLGNLLSTSGDVAGALKHYRLAIALGDSSPGLYSSLGSILIQVGEFDEAISVLHKAQELAPESTLAASNYLLAIQYGDRISRESKFAAARHFAERFENPLKKQWGSYSNINDENVDRKLRVGYVSGDFRSHSLAFFFEPILASHDKSRFEIFCYYAHPLVDNVTLRMQALADHWCSCYELSDEDLAAKVRQDQIDILVDLSGHTGYNRLMTFARKPAPVQMTWLGYQATTGLAAMDYRITEDALDPVGMSERFHSERLLRLPSSGTFSPSPDSPAVNALPALSSSRFTYGCLNNPTKITDEAISLWSRILLANRSAQLMLGSATPALIQNLIEKFQTLGVTSRQLVFQPKVDLATYLALHHQIDLALDTFPYNGGTTTFHSLWMGVPVIALEGDSTLSKVGVTVMSGMGLTQFCAVTQEEYVERAIYFASHLNELSMVREKLRDDMAKKVNHLTGLVTTSLEDAMQNCWRTYCDDRERRIDTH